MILVVMAIITVIIGAAGALGALAVAAFGWLRSGRRITWVSTALGAPAGLVAAGTANGGTLNRRRSFLHRVQRGGAGRPGVRSAGRWRIAVALPANPLTAGVSDRPPVLPSSVEHVPGY